MKSDLYTVTLLRDRGAKRDLRKVSLDQGIQGELHIGWGNRAGGGSVKLLKLLSPSFLVPPGRSQGALVTLLDPQIDEIGPDYFVFSGLEILSRSDLVFQQWQCRRLPAVA